jgi:drug/metabolite transporter (DMT)-like permease
MAGLTAFYSALAMGTMGIVAPAAALGVLVPLAVGLARGESPEPAQVLGIVFAIGGILLASGPELSDAGGTRPVLLALLAALLFGAMYIAMAGGAQVNAVMTVAGMRVTTLTVIVGLVLVTRSVGGLGRADVPVITAIGISDGVANLTWVVASTMGLLSITSVLGSLYPVVTAVLAAVLHHERLRPVQYVGVVGAIAGVILISAGG